MRTRCLQFFDMDLSRSLYRWESARLFGCFFFDIILQIFPIERRKEWMRGTVQQDCSYLHFM